MNQRRRLAAGAAIAGVLVTPPAALASSSPNPADESNGSTADGPVTALPLPEGLARCLIDNGFPALPAGTKVDLPAIAGALPAGFAGTLPLPGTGVPTATGTIPLSGIGVPTTTGTSPLSGVGVPTTTGTSPLSGVNVPTTSTGTTSPPAYGDATGTGAVQCGQVILNSTIYMVLVTIPTTTTTTTTTTANGPMTAADGPVTITGNAPAAAPVTATGNPPAAAPLSTTPGATGRGKPPAAHRRHRRKRATVRRHSSHNRARRAKRQLHIILWKKSPGHGSRRVTALPAHAGRGS